MFGNGRYTDYVKVESIEVIVELRIVNTSTIPCVGLGLLSNKSLQAAHWDELNKIIIKAVTKHIKLNNDQTEPGCDNTVTEIEGEHVNIAYFFKPCVAPLPYDLSPYQRKVSTPAEAFESVSGAGVFSPRPYPYMMMIAVAPRYTNTHPVKPSNIIPDSDVDSFSCDTSDSELLLDKELCTLGQNNSKPSVSKLNRLKSKYAQLSSKSTANSTYRHVRSGSEGDDVDLMFSKLETGLSIELELDTGKMNTPCSTPIQNSNRRDGQGFVNVSDDEDRFDENLNASSQYITISKVSKYTGEEFVTYIHNNDLSCTQTFSNLGDTPQTQSASSIPFEKGPDEEIKPAYSWDSLSCSNYEAECSSESSRTTASSSKPKTMNFYEPSVKSRQQKSFLESASSTHSMLMRSNISCKSPSSSSVADEKHVKKHGRMLLVHEKDVYEGTKKRTPNGSRDKTAVAGSSTVEDTSSDNQNNRGARAYHKTKKVYSRTNAKRCLSLKSSGPTLEKESKLSVLEMFSSSCVPKRGKRESSPPRTKLARRMKQDLTTRVLKQESDHSSSNELLGSTTVNRLNVVSRKKGEPSLNNEVYSPGELSESFTSLSKYSGEAPNRKGKSLKKMYAKSSDDEDIINLESKNQQLTNTRKRRNLVGKLKQVGSHIAEQNQVTETSINLKTLKQKRQKINHGKESYTDSYGSDESIITITSGESSPNMRRPQQLRFDDDVVKCTSGTTRDEQNCGSAAVENAAVNKTSGQKFTMEDLSFNDLEKMFRENILHLKEINREIRPSQRHEEYKNGNLRVQTLVFAVSTCPYSMEQLKHLSLLCRTQFCHTYEQKIKCLGYISKVLLPDLCTKLFMDRFHMNEEEALEVIEKTFVHIPHVTYDRDA